MFNKNTFKGNSLYQLTRLSPCFASIFVGGYALPGDIEGANRVIGAFLIFVMALGVWTMAEGTLMLWYRAKRENRDERKGYLAVVFIFGVVLLALLTLFRYRTSQGAFLLLLVTFSLRGAARSGWEQGRTHVAVAGAAVSNSLLAFTSFLVMNGGMSWQSISYSAALGAAAAAVEMAWNGSELNAPAVTKWAKPAFRVFLFIGPIIVGVFALSGQLPLVYAWVYLTVPIAGRITKHINATEMTSSLFAATAGVYCLFVAIILLCRLHVIGVLV